MKRLSWLVAIPVAILVIAFAIANRRDVILSFDPTSLDMPAIAFRTPLWAVAFAAFLLGLIVGGLAVWAARARSHLKRAAHKREAERAAKAPDPLEGVPSIAANPANAAPPAPLLHPPSGLISRR